MVKLLLDFKADPNLANFTYGRTPMHYAVDYKWGACVSAMVAFGASCMV
jgi:ankyrin repeat protein